MRCLKKLKLKKLNLKNKETAMKKNLTRAERGLGKYDAPLKVQFQRGYEDFKRGRVGSPFHTDTMQYREWRRGFNKAWDDNLKRVVSNEQYKTRGRPMAKGEVQHVRL